MINKDTLIKVINKDAGVVGYTIPELNIHRDFYPGEFKEIRYEELEKLTFIPGGEVILKELLEITDEQAIYQLFSKNFEPEYHYSKEDVIKVMTEGTLDQFLDCLDFAPEVIKDNIKELAVQLPLNDMSKREAIKEKLNFDVTKAIEIKNTGFDGDNSDQKEENEKKEKSGRRAAPLKSNPAPTGRRYKPDK